MEYHHTPVMLKEVLDYLKPKPGENFIDCTLGGGGYTVEIAQKILPEGKVLAVDLDEMAIKNFQNKIIKNKYKNIILSNENFKNLQSIIKENFSQNALFDGIVFDLGLSSAQLAARDRGFSFNLAAPLGMNFGDKITLTAEEIVNNWSLNDLTKIFKNYGEEKFAYKIAEAIIRQRQIGKIKTTSQLVEIIKNSIPKKFQKLNIHPATKIFQALRIAVNKELENLSQALPQAVSLLKPGGKIVAISYHSLEDRIAKQFLKQEAQNCLCPPLMPVCQCGHQAKIKILTKGVLRPTEEEVLNNPRARSAKLRAAEKI